MYTIPRQQVSILAGASGAGKTTLMMQALAEWATSGEWWTPALTWNATKVAYIVADRTMEEVMIRKARLNISDDKMQVYGIQNDLNFNLKWLDDPETALRKVLTKFTINFDMLVIDPLALFIEGNTNDLRTVAISLMKLGRIAIERDITIFAIHHASKSRSDFSFKRPQDRINGSGAFQGFSGTQMVLVEGKEDDLPYDRLWVIPHMGPMQQVNVVRDEKGDFVVMQQELTDVTFKLNKAEEIIRKFDIGEVFNITNIHKIADDKGISRDQMFNKVRDLLASGELVKTGRGEYCRREIKDGM